MLMAVIRKLAAGSARIDWSEHAMDRMSQRGISDRDAIGVLRNGDIEGKVTPGHARDEWQCKVCCAVEGGRDVGVATVVIGTSRLLVKTVE